MFLKKCTKKKCEQQSIPVVCWIVAGQVMRACAETPASAEDNEITTEATCLIFPAVHLMNTLWLLQTRVVWSIDARTNDFFSWQCTHHRLFDHLHCNKSFELSFEVDCQTLDVFAIAGGSFKKHCLWFFNVFNNETLAGWMTFSCRTLPLGMENSLTFWNLANKQTNTDPPSEQSHC